MPTVPAGIAGRPDRCGWSHRRLTRSRCHRSNVAGYTKNLLRRSFGSKRARLARSARSRGCKSGRATWRRSTATSWRSMTISIASSSRSARRSRRNWSSWTNAAYRNDRAMAKSDRQILGGESPVQPFWMGFSAPTSSSIARIIGNSSLGFGFVVVVWVLGPACRGHLESRRSHQKASSARSDRILGTHTVEVPLTLLVTRSAICEDQS
jgi:hypothetical protein